MKPVHLVKDPLLSAYLTVLVASLVTSGLTLYSGFGLGTLLLPVYSLFFSVEVAIAATAVVHAASNALKIVMVGKSADRELVMRFGVPAIAAALVGAAALGYVSTFGEVYQYSVAGIDATVTPVKLTVGLLMLAFATVELLPYFRHLEFDRKYLIVGGMLSGFFGGFSGHQGALRSAFLAKVDTTPESFVGTNAVIGFMVDLVRISTYAAVLVANPAGAAGLLDSLPLVLIGVLAAFAGVVFARRYLRKVTMGTIQTITGVLLIGIALGLAAGII